MLEGQRLNLPCLSGPDVSFREVETGSAAFCWSHLKCLPLEVIDKQAPRQRDTSHKIDWDVMICAGMAWARRSGCLRGASMHGGLWGWRGCSPPSTCSGGKGTQWRRTLISSTPTENCRCWAVGWKTPYRHRTMHVAWQPCSPAAVRSAERRCRVWVLLRVNDVTSGVAPLLSLRHVMACKAW